MPTDITQDFVKSSNCAKASTKIMDIAQERARVSIPNEILLLWIANNPGLAALQIAQIAVQAINNTNIPTAGTGQQLFANVANDYELYGSEEQQ